MIESQVWSLKDLFEIAGNGSNVRDFVGAFASTADFETSQFGNSNQRDFGIKDNT